jgi:hypothetical protein
MKILLYLLATKKKTAATETGHLLGLPIEELNDGYEPLEISVAIFFFGLVFFFSFPAIVAQFRSEIFLNLRVK